MHALGALSLAVAALPLAFIAWRALTIPFRNWLPVLFFLAIILLVQGVAALGGDDLLPALIYWLAGAGKP